MSKLDDDVNKAAERLHHLSMRYAGALLELVTGKDVGMIPQGYPGLKLARDLIDLILLTRAEINALSMLLAEKKVFTREEFQHQVLEDYELFTQRKAKQLGVEVTDAGLTFKVGGDGN